MKIRKSLKIVLLLTVTLGLQCSEHAHANPVNLCDWTVDSINTFGGQIAIPSSVDTSSSGYAIFHPGWANNAYSIQYNQFGEIAPVLSGNLGTTPGIAYEISFCVYSESEALILPSLSMAFGNSTTVYSSVPAIGLGTPIGAAPLSIDFKFVATSPTTFVSFTEYSANDIGDFYNSICLSNFSVTEVPDTSSTIMLLGLGGGALLVASRWRRLFQRPK